MNLHLTDTSCFADQVPLGGKTLLRVQELRHSHAGPLWFGARHGQTVTSKAASPGEALITQTVNASLPRC